MIEFENENVIDFPNASRRSRDPFSSRRGPNMQRLVFRSYNAIVESDDADLVRDVRCDLDRAQSKLRRLKQRLKNVQEQAAVQVELLTTAETKLTAAIVAALLSTVQS
jgi:hypothetical protein